MPEGHVIHRLATGLTTRFGGEEVSVVSPQGRFATEASLLDGSVLTDAEAWESTSSCTSQRARSIFTSA